MREILFRGQTSHSSAAEAEAINAWNRRIAVGGIL